MAEVQASKSMAETEGTNKYGVNLCKGYLFPQFLTEEWLEQASSAFNPRGTDLFVISYPKSGTNWLSHIVYLLVSKEKLSKPYHSETATIFEIPQVDELQSDSTTVTFTENKQMSKFRLTKALVSAIPDPRFFFTHFPYNFLPKNPATKYFYIHRNPKDIFVSMYNHFSNDTLHPEIPSFDEFFQFYVENNCFNYCEHIKSYIEHKDDPNFFILSYEDLHKNFKMKLGEMATFLGIELTEELYQLITKETNIEAMRENEFINGKALMKEGHSFFPKGKVGTWKSSLSKEQSEKIDEILLSKLGEDFIKKYITFC
ncbi:Amine sulfotransferase [Oopsacas minuta]|uniref:Amine sulfotransferase n=1 Tax=Oopsacas minuta TaxID=111878 RepID=A0AAV7KAJ0_9METZ|nr:Amine sulfotransferase [Oopsacas minuta]